MVHGGGHHHGGGSGGGGGGFQQNYSSRDNSGGWFAPQPQIHHYHHYRQNPWSWNQPSTNIWFNNINPRQYHGRRDSQTTADDSMTSNGGDCTCEDCCNRCCKWLCLWSTCCLLCQGASQARHDSATTRSAASQMQPGSLVLKMMCPSLFLSFMLLIILLSISSVTETSFTLNVGETRQIIKPHVNSHLQSSSNGGSGLTVYEFAEGGCPPLSGTPIVLQDTLSMHFEEGDYQYDYFRLNKGSTIKIDLNQTKGWTNVYLLSGHNMLQRIDGDADDHDLEGGFGKEALLKRYVSASTDSLATNTMSYRVLTTNFYIVVYDNESAKPGDLTVHYLVNAATYDLSDASPVCTPDKDPCEFGYSKRSACLILQAMGDSHSANDTVTVQLIGYRRWLPIILYSLIPLYMQIWWVLGRNRHRAYEPLGNHSVAPPPLPPTAPTAPMEATVYYADGTPIEVIPVESVEPLPPPMAPPTKG